MKQKLAALKLGAFERSFSHAVKPLNIKLADALVLLEQLCDEQLSVNKLATEQRNRRSAKLRWPDATTADVDFQRQKVLSKRELARLALADWVKEHAHVLLLGPTGVAKTTIACALSNALIELGYKVLFYRFHDLLLELKAADSQDDRRIFNSLLRKLVNVPVLVIDDWAIAPMSEVHRRLLFDVVEKRDGKGSLIITSQYKPSQWHSALGDSTIADAILDRIVHSANVYDFEKVESFRKLNALKGGKAHASAK